MLGKLLDLYAAPDATHPVPGGASSIAQVFLLPALNSDSAGGARRIIAQAKEPAAAHSAPSSPSST